MNKFIYLILLLLMISSVSALSEINELNLTIIITDQDYVFDSEKDTLVFNTQNTELKISQNNLILPQATILDMQERYNPETLEDDILTMLEIQTNTDLSQYRDYEEVVMVEAQPPTTTEVIFTSSALFWLIVALALLVAAIISLKNFFTILQETSPKYKEIKLYLETNLKKGYEPAQLKLALVARGYNQKLVEKIESKLR